MKTRSISLAIGLALVLCSSLIAQQKAAQPTSPQAPEATAEAADRPQATELSALSQRALALLLQAGEEARSLKEAYQRARIQAAVADALWDHDAGHARELFQSAFEVALDYYRESKDDNLRQVTRGGFVSRADMRQEIIKLASRHDAALGRALTEQYIEERERELQAQSQPSSRLRTNPLLGTVDPAANNLLSVASSLLEVDLKAAVELAQRAFALGLPQSSSHFFANLARRDRAAADQLYLSVIERIGQDQAALPGQLLLLAAYPFGENRVWIADGEQTNSMAFPALTDFKLDPALIERFLAAAFALLSRTYHLNPAQVPDVPSRLRVALFALRLLEAKVAQYQPALLPQWRELAGQIATLVTGQSRDRIEQTIQQTAQERAPNLASPQTAQVQDLLDRAQQTSNLSRRDDLYREAAFAANRQGDLARAIEIAGRISNFDYRRQVQAWLYFEAATRAITENRLDEARRLALEITATDQRAYLFFQIARAALKEKDRPRANELLEEAIKQATKAENTQEKLRALLGLAYTYASFDPIRGFEVADEAIRTANQIPHYEPDQGRLVRSLESPDKSSSHISVANEEGFDLGKTLAVLAPTDFDRALWLAQSLASKPLQLSALVAVAASVLKQK